MGCSIYLSGFRISVFNYFTEIIDAGLIPEIGISEKNQDKAYFEVLDVVEMNEYKNGSNMADEIIVTNDSIPLH